MRTSLRSLFSLLAAFILPVALWANVIVKGTVKYPNGLFANNYEVHIGIDSIPGTTNACLQEHVRKTNANGFYQDTLFCNTNPTAVYAWVRNCDGNVIYKTPIVTNVGFYEINFEVCLNTACQSNFNFNFNTGSPFKVNFNDSSRAGSSADSIVKFKWNFGDGTVDSVNKNPTHTYAAPGVYNVCHSIRTASGCVSEKCKTVQIANNECRPEFTFEPITATPNLIKFNSTTSTVSANDSIVARKWTFGDGTTMDGNVIAPQHQYATGGTYTVCLTTKTKLGCEKAVCKQVVFGLTCQSNFIFNFNTGSSFKVNFTDSSRAGSSTDSIVKFKWNFGDGTVDSVNRNPTHTYAAPGVYNVCHSIRTASGCVSENCKAVQIVNNECRPEFTFEPITSAPNLIKFNSSTSTVSANDSIVARKWTFGDGTTMDGNVIAPQHQYATGGTYTVCLTIKTKSGCEKTVCKPVIFGVPVNCHAEWVHELVPANSANGMNVRFHSSMSTTGANDSIVSRRWKFGDGTGADGNIIDPLHLYLQPGTYTVCLVITSAKGCKDSICKLVVIPTTTPNCQPRFTKFATGLSVKFNSNISIPAVGDSIVYRLWTFGDGTSATTVDPTHVFPRPGVYEVCLKIQTRGGCLAKICQQVAVVNVAGNCVPYFSAEQTGAYLRTTKFNSSMAYTQLAGDSIVGRKWTFGDGTSLDGNIISPTHMYQARGTYTVCLQLRTRLGCETRWCREIVVQGPDSTGEAVRILNLYPVPVSTVLNAVIWSRDNNVNSELAIYDVYGVKKWSQNKILFMGNSTHQIPVSQLANGPYIFKVKTAFGVISRNFYKLQ